MKSVKTQAEPFRARFKSGIVAEFWRPTKASSKVLMLCDSLPAVPAQQDVLRYFARLGFWVFHIRYRGTWESSGIFLQHAPHKDVELLMKGIGKEFCEEQTGKSFRIRRPEFYVVGSSFGGTAAVFASLSPKVKRAVALAPVSDWRKQDRHGALRSLRQFIRSGFGPAYRIQEGHWKKLKSAEFFSPANSGARFERDKVLVIHSRYDKIVQIGQSIAFCEERNIRLVKMAGSGHLSLDDVLTPRIRREIVGFFG